MAMHYIVLVLNYDDILVHKKQRQIIYMRWNGVVNGSFYPDFVHTTVFERESINKYLSKYNLG
jgi:hypothetical protein